jgi:uncharacterized circularly permuted ATP-grasp superfamily protein/uncharacterized alpha-E superfamily protein
MDLAQDAPLGSRDGTPIDLTQGQLFTGSYDELRDGHGVRPAWKILQSALQRMSAQQFTQRSEQARHLIRENGVTYNVYGQEHGMDRPWQLDLLPLMISAGEWETLASGVAQRARLLNRVIAESYSAKNSLGSELLHPSLIYAHPSYLRPCHGLRPTGGTWLHFYAADLIRGPDGAWRVLADRTQAPAGAGYALENRIVLSRALPDTYRQCGIQRLAGFFMTMRKTMVDLASKLPVRRDNPRIVLLSPGPYNETYFEHAYLARYLGYTLVEGGDLTIRDDHVYLKTLGGLHRIDVIVRRLDDDFIDPLELRNDSTLGIAGILSAARAGNVVIANAVGSAIAENAGLMPALPRLSRHLLGEELKLSGIDTWWGGSHAEYIRQHFDDLIIRPAFGGMRMAAKRGAEMTAAERAYYAERLALAPHYVVAQAPPTPSSTPIWNGQRCETRSLVLRVFAVASGDNYHVMPGGLARIADHDQPWAVSFQRGGGSKDVWVISDGPVAPISLLKPSGAPVEFKRGNADLPSRVADNLFWFGRYGARAEDLARVLRAGLIRQVGNQERIDDEGISSVVRILRKQGCLPEEALSEVGTALVELIFSEKNPTSLLSIVRRLHYAAFSSRDRLSNDTWRIINHLEQDLATQQPLTTIDAIPMLDRIIVDLAALAGMANENTTRGPGWRFLDLGRRLERANFIAELIQATLVPPTDDAILDTVLEIADNAITYRARYLMSLQIPPMLDLLLSDATNPRSLVFQLERVVDHVMHLPRPQEQALPTTSERLAIGAHTWVRLIDPLALSDVDENNERSHLDHVLSHLSSDLSVLSDAVTKQYLNHATATRQHAAGMGDAT